MEETNVIPFLRVVESQPEQKPEPDKTHAEAAADALEKAAEFIRENGCNTLLCAVLLPEDRLALWRNKELPMHEALGIVEMVKLHIIDDYGKLTDSED